MPSDDVMEVKIPLTFRLKGGTDEVEQDTTEEIFQCTLNVLRTPIEHFEDAPEFGLADQALQKNGADLEEIEEALDEWEPRAATEISRDPEFLQTAIDHVKVRVE